MSSRHESNEGVIIAWALLLIVVCLAGSVVTRKSLVDFIFIALFIVLNLMVLGGIIIGFISVFIYAFKREKGDKRSLAQVFRQEYAHNRLVDTYGLFFSYLGEYLAETETYVTAMRYFARIESYVVRFFLHPVKALTNRWDDEAEDAGAKAGPFTLKAGEAVSVDEALNETKATEAEGEAFKPGFAEDEKHSS